MLWGEGVDVETVARIPDFLVALTNDDWMDWLAEYDTDLPVEAGRLAGQPGTGQVIGRGTFAGVRQVAPTARGPDLHEEDIGSELRRQIAGGHLPPPDADTVYALFFPPGISITTASGARTCVELCGFHGTASAVTDAGLDYLILPDHRAPDSVHGGGCNVGCGLLDPFSNLSTITSHELAEAMTNPEVGRAPPGDAPLAWYDEINGEIGDVCSGVSMLAAPDGGSFAAQQLYSRRGGVCQSARQFSGSEPEFKIWLPSNRATLSAGAVLDVAVSTTTVHGAPQPLLLTVPALPGGVTALAPATLTSGESFTVRLAVAADAGPLSDAVVRLVAIGATTHSASLLLQVVGDFALEVSPTTATAVVGGSPAAYSVRVVALGPPTMVSLAVSGLPDGVSASLAQSSVLSGDRTTLTVTADSSAAPEGAVLTVTGSAGALSHSADVSLAIGRSSSSCAGVGPGLLGLAALSWISRLFSTTRGRPAVRWRSGRDRAGTGPEPGRG